MISSGSETVTPKVNKIKEGKWSKTENDRFMKGLQLHGRNWIKVQRKVKTRTVIQVRSHAQKMFQNMSKSDIDALVRRSDEASEDQNERFDDQKGKKNIKLPKRNESERRKKSFSEGETNEKGSNEVGNEEKED